MADFISPFKESITKPTVNYGLRASATISIIEIEATLELKSLGYREDDNYEERTWKIEGCYHGKSTRRVSTKQNPEEELTKQREKMTEEAKRAALIECFRERLGFTEFNDMVFDELNRPIHV